MNVVRDWRHAGALYDLVTDRGGRLCHPDPLVDQVFRPVPSAVQLRLDAADRAKPKRRRKVAAPRYPIQVEARLRAYVVRRLAGWRSLVEAAFAPVYARLDAVDASVRTDAADDVASLVRVVEKAGDRWRKVAPDARGVLHREGTQIDLFAREELARQMPTVARIAVQNAPTERALVNEWTDKAWRFVQDADAKAVDRVAKAVRDAAVGGLSTPKLRAQVQEALGVAESRARLIARDQVAKFNAEITRTRQTKAGITRYEWSTSKDDRVRESHEAKEGGIFEWANPPADTGHPGEDIQCRCVAIPVLDDLDAAAFGQDFADARKAPSAVTVGEDGVIRLRDPDTIARTPRLSPSSRVYDPDKRARWEERQRARQAQAEALRPDPPAPAPAPVTVQPAGPQPPGFAVPAPPPGLQVSPIPEPANRLPTVRQGERAPDATPDQARIVQQAAALPATDRSALDFVAALSGGQPVSFIARNTGIPIGQAREAVARLVDAGLIRAIGTSGTGRGGAREPVYDLTKRYRDAKDASANAGKTKDQLMREVLGTR